MPDTASLHRQFADKRNKQNGACTSGVPQPD
jgi:hypothetical protein